MTPLLKELSELDVEPLEIAVPDPSPEQDSSLDTLTATSSNTETGALWTGRLPTFGPCCVCGCCCCDCCLCCCV